MMKQQYRLFYRDTEIGDTTQEDADFPNMFGTFRPAAESHGDAIRDRIQQYIDYSVAADHLMQEGKEEEWEGFCSEHEPQFLDLIETDDWHLLGQEASRLSSSRSSPKKAASYGGGT